MDLHLQMIGRSEELFGADLERHERELSGRVRDSSFLVIGGAGSIGQAVVKEIFKRGARRLHVVDISENNLVELVRDIRSSLGYEVADFQALPLDCGSREFERFYSWMEGYDYVLNLSALKHVRSEKDPYTLMRMIDVNILNTVKTLELALSGRARKYFCVSTDKAANPVNMMGASKKIMEAFLMRASSQLPVSTARFANVAFSDGSLPFGFTQRIAKRQPLSAPRDVRRYFVTQRESGQLCLMSCIFGENRDIYFPKLDEKLNQITFSEIAVNYLHSIGLEPYVCSSEEEARSRVEELASQKKWPCWFFDSDTTGEKDFEEFYTEQEIVDLKAYHSMGVIKTSVGFDEELLNQFLDRLAAIKNGAEWHKQDLVDLFNDTLPEFKHLETFKYLDQRM